MFNLFQPRPDLHLRRVAQLLREANMARIEHQAAAEHHNALAHMYAERAARLEGELRDAFPGMLHNAPATPEQERRVELEALASGRPRLSSL